MKMTQITAIKSDNGNYPIVIGLGTDNKVYEWDANEERWNLYTFKRNPEELEAMAKQLDPVTRNRYRGNPAR